MLLVEDNLEHALLAKRGLADDRFDVIHVRTGAEALEATERTRFDVCLLDQRLPDGDGIDLCRSLRDTGQDGLIFLVTSTTREAVADKAFRAGADDYVVKGPSFMGRIAENVKSSLGG